MNLEPNLYKAILENPNDDGARLALSDWLEEHGDQPRAEFIRVQIETEERGKVCAAVAARLGRVNNRPYHDAVITWNKPYLRSQDLLKKHGEDWARDFALLTSTDWGPYGTYKDRLELQWAWGWERGFIDYLSLHPHSFFAYADKICWHPQQKCRFCRGKGETRCQQPAASNKKTPCYGCGGTGKAEFPPFAQPITKINFTARPNIHITPSSLPPKYFRKCWFLNYPDDGVVIDYLEHWEAGTDRIINTLLKKYWHWIKFEFPA